MILLCLRMKCCSMAAPNHCGSWRCKLVLSVHQLPPSDTVSFDTIVQIRGGRLWFKNNSIWVDNPQAVIMPITRAEHGYKVCLCILVRRLTMQGKRGRTVGGHCLNINYVISLQGEEESVYRLRTPCWLRSTAGYGLDLLAGVEQIISGTCCPSWYEKITRSPYSLNEEPLPTM